jgi:hypothetical protein
MSITHVLVVTDGTQDNTTLDIIEVLEALPISDSTSLIVTDNAQSAITILAETLSNTELALWKKSAQKKLSN